MQWRYAPLFPDKEEVRSKGSPTTFLVIPTNTQEPSRTPRKAATMFARHTMPKYVAASKLKCLKSSKIRSDTPAYSGLLPQPATVAPLSSQHARTVSAQPRTAADTTVPRDGFASLAAPWFHVRSRSQLAVLTWILLVRRKPWTQIQIQIQIQIRIPIRLRGHGIRQYQRWQRRHGQGSRRQLQVNTARSKLFSLRCVRRWQDWSETIQRRCETRRSCYGSHVRMTTWPAPPASHLLCGNNLRAHDVPGRISIISTPGVHKSARGPINSKLCVWPGMLVPIVHRPTLHAWLRNAVRDRNPAIPVTTLLVHFRMGLLPTCCS